MRSPSRADRCGRAAGLGVAALGATLGGLAGGFVVVGVTLVLKTGMDFVARQQLSFVVVVPVLGLALAVLVLQGLGKSAANPPPRAGGARARAWRTFPPDAIRADISGDVVDSAGREERFPWRLAPIRALAILATVGTGGAMGTEAPAAYLGVAAGACLGDRGQRWRRLLRPAALAGGAAGVAALMGIALVGTAFMLELGRRRRAPLDVERVGAALIGGLIGWGIDTSLGLKLISLVVPHEPPRTLAQAVITALFIGAASGAISSLAGLAVYRAKQWAAAPAVKLALGAAASVATALVLAAIAMPSAAAGPGTGAILWAERTEALPLQALAVCLLRAVATTAAVAAGGCGGVFVPFLAVGDLAGRVFAPGLRVGNDLAGASGAAGGIAGGYRLPWTAIAMVLGVGGPHRAMLTSMATVVVAFFCALGAESAWNAIEGAWLSRRRAPAH
jgi:H+/Cl- antiporter ClcA